MINPEIKDLIKPLEQYMTPDQKSELEKILSIGKKLKEEGEQKKQEFRKNYNRSVFIEELLNYSIKKKKRETENLGFNKSKLDITSIMSNIFLIGGKKGLKEIGYKKMGPIEKKKFEDMFLRDLILYTRYKYLRNPQKYTSTDSIEEFKDNGFKKFFSLTLYNFEIGPDLLKILLQTLEKTDGLKEGTTLHLENTEIGAEGAIALAKILEKTGGLKTGSELNLCGNNIGDYGAKAIIMALYKTDGLKEGAILNLIGTEIGVDGAKAIAEMLSKTGGLKAGSELHLRGNNIGDEGAVAIAEAIAKTGGLKHLSKLNLAYTEIGADGAIALANMLEKTGGLEYGSELILSNNEIGEAGKAAFQKFQDDTKVKGIKYQMKF